MWVYRLNCIYWIYFVVYQTSATCSTYFQLFISIYSTSWILHLIFYLSFFFFFFFFFVSLTANHQDNKKWNVKKSTARSFLFCPFCSIAQTVFFQFSVFDLNHTEREKDPLHDYRINSEKIDGIINVPKLFGGHKNQ